LVKLSSGLKTDIAHLLGSEPIAELAKSASFAAAAPRLGRRCITRAQEGLRLETSAHFYSYLANDILNKSMTPLIIDVKHGVNDGQVDFLRHVGEEFILILEGEVLFTCELYSPVVLKAGDSMYFDAEMGHAYVRNTNSRSRLLLVSANRAETEAPRSPILANSE